MMQDESAGWKAVFTQVSLFSTLLCGKYGGVVTVGEVKKLGNACIATMDRLDGEVQMLDGVLYQARSDGSVRCPEDHETIPFGTVARFPDALDAPGCLVRELGHVASYQAFEEEVDSWLGNLNLPWCIRLHGVFSHVKYRTVRRQEQDGVGLAQAAEGQAVFETSDIEGDLVGFRMPDYFAMLNAPGWHLHFMDGARSCGGHLVNFDLRHGTLQGCSAGDYRLVLPDSLAGLELARDRRDDMRRAEAQR